jgi:integrase
VGKRTTNITKQVMDKIMSMEALGTKKHEVKQEEKQKAFANGENWNPARTDKLFTHSTIDNYKRWAIPAAKWIHDNYKIKQDIRRIKPDMMAAYINYYKSANPDRIKSESTVHSVAAAMVKVLGAGRYTMTDVKEAGAEIGTRSRENITKGRDMVKGFDYVKHADMLRFNAACGLRERGMMTVRHDNFKEINGQIHVTIREKGGRERTALVLPSEQSWVRQFLQDRLNNGVVGPNNEVLPKRVYEQTNKNGEKTGKIVVKAVEMPDRFPSHAMRRSYANELYSQTLEKWKAEGRDLGETWRRSDGKVFYRDIAGYVSHMLGHSETRIDVVIKHYLT